MSRRLFTPNMRRAGAAGTTLIETVVSVGVLAFILSFVAFLIFMASINAYNVHDQAQAQSQAAAAMERLTSEMRRASQFTPCAGDSIPFDSNTTFTRIQFTVPPPNTSIGVAQTSVVAWHPGDPGASPRVPPSVQYFADAEEAEFDVKGYPTGEPTESYPNISTFSIRWEGRHRVQLALGYQYRGFALNFVRPEVPQIGQFVTDVVAKNHYLPLSTAEGYASSYDDATTNTLVSL